LYETFGFAYFYLNQKDLVGIWQKVKKRERAERKAANTCSHQRNRIKKKRPTARQQLSVHLYLKQAGGVPKK